MEELIKTGTLVLAQFVELMAAVIVCFASAKAFAQFARDRAQFEREHSSKGWH